MLDQGQHCPVKQYVVVLRPGRLGFASATASDTCKAMSDQHIGPSGGIVEFYHANSGSTRQWSPSPFHARIFHSIPQHHHSKLFMHQSMCERPCPETRFWAPRPVAALTPKSAPWSSWRWGGSSAAMAPALQSPMSQHHPANLDAAICHQQHPVMHL